MNHKRRRCSLFSVRDGWWQCDRCGGVWPNPKFGNPDLQAEFDAVTTCSTCVSLEMAKSLIQDLQKWNPSNEPPKHDNFIALLLINDKGEYSWVKARHTEGLISGVPTYGYRFAECNMPVELTNFIAIGWRDLPPMPEVEA